MNTAAPRSGDGTIGKALEVLDLVAQAERPVRFSELLTMSPHPKATLYRLVQTLTNLGMLRYDTDRQTYAPGLRLVSLAHAAWRQSSLAPIARAHIDALSETVGETVHLAQLDGGQVLYVDKRNAAEPLEMFSQAGKVGPGYCTGVGKAMLAFLADEALEVALSQQAWFAHTAHTHTSRESLSRELAAIRSEGVAYDREEHEPGIICIAAPILSDVGRSIGALSVTTSTSRRSLDDLAMLAPHLQSTARDIAGAAANWQFPSQ
ncbi:IclR family transcriptional regulator [uncultured Tateyamaria sp.]|uniref:IclR family transcriptional regulator n=1 Tax=uncultured Tateyamaria sp. TaxID=455651 RepID=UPI00260B5A3D|nr:IclR family transcriptional regulator [uncultured Tateyamaria sp.]